MSLEQYKKVKVSLKGRLSRHLESFKVGDAVEFGSWKIGTICADRDMCIEDRIVIWIKVNNIN